MRPGLHQSRLAEHAPPADSRGGKGLGEIEYFLVRHLIRASLRLLSRGWTFAAWAAVSSYRMDLQRLNEDK